METTVTRNGQITLAKDIRETLGIKVGTRLIINKIGDVIMIKKKDKSFWERYKGGALPKDFDYKKLRVDNRERLKRLKIV